MKRRRRRFGAYLVAFLAMLVLFTVGYVWMMQTFENEQRTLSEALLVTIETFTTTGYGEDADYWESSSMILYMAAMQFTGVVFIFMALPLFVVPWLEGRLSTTPPARLDGLTDHVVICAYSRRTEKLVQELERATVPYVVIEPDRDRATNLVENDRTVIHGDPRAETGLENACLTDARALVADVDDETNAVVALTAADLCSGLDVDIITFAEDPQISEYHRYAGADSVFTPRQLIGESLAMKVTKGVNSDGDDAVEIGEDFEIAELPVQSGSELAGVTIADSGIRERTGAHVIGAWLRGEFVASLSPSTVITERSVLLVSGTESQLQRLRELTLSETRRHRHGPVLVCGYGEVGSTVTSGVSQTGRNCTVVDLEDSPSVDVVGDVTDVETLERAGIDQASTVVLALSNDTATVFATLLIRQLDSDVEIVARANDPETVKNLYRAGADYVLALGTVSGRMLASTVLNEEVISYDQQVDIVRMGCGGLEGRTIEQADIRARTGCTIIAIERDGALITDFDTDFQFVAGDELVVAGPDRAVAELTELH